jgi:hypothetical protein
MRALRKPRKQPQRNTGLPFSPPEPRSALSIYATCLIAKSNERFRARSAANPSGGQHFLHAARRLTEALLILDERDPDKALTFLAEADTGSDGDMRLG